MSFLAGLFPLFRCESTPVIAHLKVQHRGFESDQDVDAARIRMPNRVGNGLPADADRGHFQGSGQPAPLAPGRH